MWRSEKDSSDLLYHLCLFHLQRVSLNPELSREPASPSLPPVSMPHSIGITAAHMSTPAFYMSTGDLNSGLHTCRACTLSHSSEAIFLAQNCQTIIKVSIFISTVAKHSTSPHCLGQFRHSSSCAFLQCGNHRTCTTYQSEFVHLMPSSVLGQVDCL